MSSYCKLNNYVRLYSTISLERFLAVFVKHTLHSAKLIPERFSSGFRLLLWCRTMMLYNRLLYSTLHHYTFAVFTHFHTTLVVASPDRESLVVEADWPGYIAHEPKGENGFGYDPLFLISVLVFMYTFSPYSIVFSSYQTFRIYNPIMTACPFC